MSMVAVTASTSRRPLDPRALRELRTHVQGDLVAPGDPGFDTFRRVFNAMIDRYPALILRPRCPEDIQRAIFFARQHDLPLSIKGSGHNVAGSAVCDGGLMLDLGLLKGIQIDPGRRVAVAQPGLVLGEVDAATQAFGLATPLGTAVHGRAGSEPSNS